MQAHGCHLSATCQVPQLAEVAKSKAAQLCVACRSTFRAGVRPVENQLVVGKHSHQTFPGVDVEVMKLGLTNNDVARYKTLPAKALASPMFAPYAKVHIWCEPR